MHAASHARVLGLSIYLIIFMASCPGTPPPAPAPSDPGGTPFDSAPQLVTLLQDNRVRISFGDCAKPAFPEFAHLEVTSVEPDIGRISVALTAPSGMIAEPASTCFLNAEFGVVGSSLEGAATTATGHVTLFAELVSEGGAAVPIYSVDVSLNVVTSALQTVGNGPQSIDYCKPDDGSCGGPLPGTQRLMIEIGEIPFEVNRAYIAQIQLAVSAGTDFPFGNNGGTLGISVTVDRIEVGFD